MNTLNPQFLAPSPANVARVVAARKAGVVYSTSTPATPGEAPVVEARLTQTVTVAAEVRAEARANQRTKRIHRPRVAKRAFSRLTAPEFDPALVSRTLSPR